MYIKKYSVYINNGLYVSDLNKAEAESLTEVLYNYLQLEDVEKIKIKEENETVEKHYALIDERKQDTFIYKFEREAEAEYEAFKHWHKLTNRERKERGQFELVYFENEQNFDNLGEYQETIINFLNKTPYLFNSVTSEYLTEEEAINEYHRILEEESKPHEDIYDICEGLNNLDYYGCGSVFDVIYKWIE